MALKVECHGCAMDWSTCGGIFNGYPYRIGCMPASERLEPMKAGKKVAAELLRVAVK